MNLLLKISIFNLYLIFFIIQPSFSKLITLEQYNCTAKDFNLNSTLKNQIFSKALIKETEEILPYRLSENRTEILHHFFEQNAVKYITIYNYSEITRGNSTYLKISINPNINSLKTSLINLGIFLNKKTQCEINTENFDQQDFTELKNLCVLSNIYESNNTAPSHLTIKKISKSLYTGILKYKDNFWSATSDTLSGLWETLWGNYFNLPEIRAMYSKRIILWAGPWVTTSGLEGFWDILKNKHELIEGVSLISIEFNEGIYGKWEIISTRAELIKSFLSDYLGKRNMDFKIQNSIITFKNDLISNGETTP